eukprot:4710522-Amphidinium_carterae.1
MGRLLLSFGDLAGRLSLRLKLVPAFSVGPLACAFQHPLGTPPHVMPLWRRVLPCPSFTGLVSLPERLSELDPDFASPCPKMAMLRRRFLHVCVRLHILFT